MGKTAYVLYSGITGPNGADYMAIYCITALESMGYTVHQIGRYAGGLPDRIVADKADFALCINGLNLPVSLVQSITSTKTPFVLWTQNDEMSQYKAKGIALAPYINLYCSYTKRGLSDFEKITKTCLLPIAASKHHFFPVPVDSQDIDICMIGYHHAKRVQILDEIQKKLSTHKCLFSFSFNLPFKDICNIYSRSKIVIAPYMDCDINGLAWGCPCRTFEVPATKSFHLQINREGLSSVFLNNERAVVETSDSSVWAAHINYWLTKDKERQEIAQASYKRVQKDHYYEHRMTQIIEALHGN